MRHRRRKVSNLLLSGAKRGAMVKPEESSELFQARRWSWKRQHVRAIQELACINMSSNELRASVDRKSIRRERVQWKAIALARTRGRTTMRRSQCAANNKLFGGLQSRARSYFLAYATATLDLWCHPSGARHPQIRITVRRLIYWASATSSLPSSWGAAG